MQVFHPDALEDLYFVVDEDCEMDVMTALGIERPAAEKIPRRYAEAQGENEG